MKIEFKRIVTWSKVFTRLVVDNQQIPFYYYSETYHDDFVIYLNLVFNKASFKTESEMRYYLIDKYCQSINMVLTK